MGCKDNRQSQWANAIAGGLCCTGLTQSGQLAVGGSRALRIEMRDPDPDVSRAGPPWTRMGDGEHSNRGRRSGASSMRRAFAGERAGEQKSERARRRTRPASRPGWALRGRPLWEETDEGRWIAEVAQQMWSAAGKLHWPPRQATRTTAHGGRGSFGSFGSRDVLDVSRWEHRREECMI